MEGDRHLLCMIVNDPTASSRQLEARWPSVTILLMSASSIGQHILHRGQRAIVCLHSIPLMTNHRRPHLQWTHDQRA